MEKTIENSMQKTFGRRSFLVGSAVTLGLAALAANGCAPKKTLEDSGGPVKEKPVEQEYQGCCRGNCASICSTKVTVRDGKVVKTSGYHMEHPDDTRLCVRGYTHLQRIYADNRIKYPLRRKEGTARGAGEWEQITWDEAIEEITTKWKKYREEFGDLSIVRYPGTGTSGIGTDYGLRLFKAMGSLSVFFACDVANNYYSSPNTIGWTPWFFGSDPKTMVDAKNIVCWSDNPTDSLMMAYPYLQRALDAGAKLTVIDPQFTGIAAKADKWIRIRPATDAVLAFAMINIMNDEGLVNDEFLRSRTVAPYLVKESDGYFLRMSDLGVEPIEVENPYTGQPMPYNPPVVRREDGSIGTADDTPDPIIRGSFEIEGHKVTTAFDLLLERAAEYTPERASEITTIPVEDIYELTHTYVDGPTTMYMANGIDHQENGGPAYNATYAVAFVSGQYGISGAGFGGGLTCNIGMGILNSAATGLSDLSASSESTEALRIFAPRFPQSVMKGKHGATEIPVKSLFLWRNNTLRTSTGKAEWLKALEKIELVICSDVVMTETAKYCDIVLPAAHFFEYEEICNSITPYIQLNEKAVDPPFEAKSDFEMFTLLTKGMGLDKEVNMEWEDYARLSLDTDTARSFGITLEALKEKKRIYCAQDGFISGETNNFLTATGRAQFYVEDVKPLDDYDELVKSGQFDRRKEALPYWEPPTESWHENPLHEKYPLHLMTRRSRMKCHTQFTHCQWLLELWPEPYIFMNAQDAAARGIKTGDVVKVFNDRGYMVCKAVSSNGIQPGTIMQDHGWVEDQFIEGNMADLLTIETHMASSHQAWYNNLCEIEKV
jgi:molybdopterin-containing oxidoreductase family molybdopterin binding subunit